MSNDEVTWIVLARDVTGTVLVSGQAQVTVALILDGDTGLVRGASVGETVRQASCDAARAALGTAAGPLPPRRPTRVVYDQDHATAILAALAETLPDPPQPELISAAPPAQAEDIVDSLIGHLRGVPQPTDPPDVSDWAMVYAQARAYLRARPWHVWSDADRLELTVDISGESACFVVVVYGSQGVQRGLAALPAPASAPVASARRGPGTRPRSPGFPGGIAGSPGLPEGALSLHLDPPREVPREHLARALRYGWPDDADFAPIVARLGPHGLHDLDRTGARQLALALAAVVAHRGPRRTGTSTGTVELGNGGPGRYTISDQR